MELTNVDGTDTEQIGWTCSRVPLPKEAQTLSAESDTRYPKAEFLFDERCSHYSHPVFHFSHYAIADIGSSEPYSQTNPRLIAVSDTTSSPCHLGVVLVLLDTAPATATRTLGRIQGGGGKFQRNSILARTPRAAKPRTGQVLNDQAQRLAAYQGKTMVSSAYESSVATLTDWTHAIQPLSFWA